MRTFHGVAEIEGAVGEHLGFSEWREITQGQIDTFAEATDDHQWIHVDPERAKDGPFGTTVAHGYLTLSLLSALLWEVYRIDGVSMTLNYGLNRVRFPSPVRVGARVRGGVKIASAEKVKSGGTQVIFDVVIEIEGEDRPACVAESIALVMP